MPPINAAMGRRDWAMVIALSVLWGGSFLFVGVAVREMPPLVLVTARVVLAALALHAALRLTGTPFPMSRAAWAAFLGMGLLNNAIPFTLIAWGQAHIAAGLASILNATTPLFTVLVAHWLTADERMRGRRLAGVAIGFAGVAVMVGGAALREIGVDVAAQLAVLAAAVSYAFAGVFGRRFKALGIPPLATAAGQVTGSSLLLVPVTLAMAPPWGLPVPGWSALLSVLGLALLSTALAYILFFRILASAGATNVAIVTFLIPVSAVVLGALVLGERLEPKHLGGMALIGLGLAVLDGRPLAWLSGAARPRRSG